ncbi:MAG: ornithine carbamoyltransferase [Oscillospiraceae bacterium]|nr:ornithine carbamoyltransferase [Oscillospiraceae bacterium]
MAVNLKGRSFLTLEDFTPEEIRYLLDLGHDLKAKRRAGICGDTLKGKHIVLLFEKTSTRTRCSFEVAATQEGAHVTYLDAGSSQMGKKESLEDSARVLGRFFDGIEYRGYDQKVVEDLAKWAGVPVWNGLTDADHPTQILADMMTIEEHCNKPLNKIKVVFPGDVRNNMCYAWMIGAAKMGMHFVALGPEELAREMDKELIKRVFATARENGGLIEITDHMEDLKGADVIYGDIFASMGEEDKMARRAELLAPYRVTMDMLKATENPEVKYLHCLPSFHDFETRMAKEWREKGVDIREVEDEVFRSRHSVVFDEAENRMHSIKAILVATIGK